MLRRETRKIKKLNSPCYLTVALEFDGPTKCEVTRDVFAYIIFSAVKTLHGEVAAAEPLDLLDFDQEALQGTIRCTRQSLEKIWSALTLYGSCNGQRCLFHINEIPSPKVDKEIQESSESIIEQSGNDACDNEMKSEGMTLIL